MCALLTLIAFVLGAAAGAAFALLALYRNHRHRDQEWLKHRCAFAAREVSETIGRPEVLEAVYQRSRSGHNFRKDRMFYEGVRSVLLRNFCRYNPDHNKEAVR